MALTMVHLAAANLWAQKHPEYLESPEFYYGAISPDAVHVRDGSDKSHKNEVHLNNWVSPHPDDVIRYWLEHDTPFDIGYGVHVLTDGQWVPRYKERLPGIMRPNGLLNTDIYYNDSFITDFMLHDTRPRLRQILDMVERAQTPGDHPVLEGYMFSRWRADILEAYRGQCPKHDPVQFIDEAYVDAFIADCIPLIEDTYQKLMKLRA
jgi:hypothetical protein